MDRAMEIDGASRVEESEGSERGAMGRERDSERTRERGLERKQKREWMGKEERKWRKGVEVFLLAGDDPHLYKLLMARTGNKRLSPR